MKKAPIFRALLGGFLYALLASPHVVMADGMPAADTAIKAGQTAPLAELGFASFKTLWIPARYTNTEKNALFIGNKKYVAPGGYDNALGFLPTDYGYMVAVRQPAGTVVISSQAFKPVGTPTFTPEELAKMPPEQRLKAMELQMQAMQMQMQSMQQKPQTTVVSAAAKGQESVAFYSVSPTGEMLGVVGEIQSGSAAWVTNDAIYVRRDAGTKNGDSGNRSRNVYDYIGFTRMGEQVIGPQAAAHAAPGPNGDWYWTTVRQNGEGLEYRHTDKGGAVRKLSVIDASRTARHWEMWTSQQAFVDMPPIADTVRTGRVLTTEWNLNLGGGGLYLAPLDLSQRGLWLGSNESEAGIADMAFRAGLFGSVDAPWYVGQAAGSEHKESGLNIYAANARNPDDHYPVFNLLSSMQNFMRNGINRGSLYSAPKSDLFVIVSPTAVIATLTGDQAYYGKNSGQGFELLTKKSVRAEEMKPFLMKYGFAVR
jgi:hypothetical protein